MIPRSEHETVDKKSIGIWGNQRLKIYYIFLPTKDGITTGWWPNICLFKTPNFEDYVSTYCIVFGMGWNMLEPCEKHQSAWVRMDWPCEGCEGVLEPAGKHGNGHSPFDIHLVQCYFPLWSSVYHLEGIFHCHVWLPKGMGFALYTKKNVQLSTI